jgi:hypothetical protein
MSLALQTHQSVALHFCESIVTSGLTFMSSRWVWLEKCGHSSTWISFLSFVDVGITCKIVCSEGFRYKFGWVQAWELQVVSSRYGWPSVVVKLLVKSWSDKSLAVTCIELAILNKISLCPEHDRVSWSIT